MVRLQDTGEDYNIAMITWYTIWRLCLKQHKSKGGKANKLSKSSYCIPKERLLPITRTYPSRSAGSVLYSIPIKSTSHTIAPTCRLTFPPWCFDSMKHLPAIYSMSAHRFPFPCSLTFFLSLENVQHDVLVGANVGLATPEVCGTSRSRLHLQERRYTACTSASGVEPSGARP